MNKNLGIIPTPHYIDCEEGGRLIVSKVYIVGERMPILESALAVLAKDNPFRESTEAEADLILLCGEENFDARYISVEDCAVFEDNYAEEQGYILKKQAEGPVVIAAKTDLGCAYGLMTLLQIIGKNIGSMVIYDRPDFRARGVKWLIWAETGIWAYDFGDGAEAYKQRVTRKLELLFRYKINLLNADGFGFNADRYPAYAGIMRHLCDEAVKRGIHVSVGGYSMSYGMMGFGNNYQGKGFRNRKSYPDGELYDCIGSYLAYKLLPGNRVDRSVRLTEVRARDWGTCLSNEELFEEKMKELEDYVRKTHVGAIGFHNMDAYEIHPELWLARCDACRKKWPNDDLMAPDGAAGAFAYFISKLLKRLHAIKDGDFDGERDLWVRMASPGYLYAEMSEDEDFDRGVEFWGKITDYLSYNKNFFVGFREQFFYHDKDVCRAEKIPCTIKNAGCLVGNFNGADGFYDDKLFVPTSALTYIMKNYSGILCENGNSFQEPLQVYNAEYMWNCDNSSFYNVSPKPTNQAEFLELYYGMINAKYRPDEVYREGGFLDIICQKLYGEEAGKEMAGIYKLCGPGGEPPIACASNVDIYTDYRKVVFPMRWDNEEITTEQIDEMCVRFAECHKMSQSAYEIATHVLESFELDENIKVDILWLQECFDMGRKLCGSLSEYMGIYKQLHACLTDKKGDPGELIPQLKSLRGRVEDYLTFVDRHAGVPVDRLGGAKVRRRELGEHLEYWTELMLSSIETKKRIPDNRKPLRTRDWW